VAAVSPTSVSVEHLASPVSIPSLTHLSVAELHSIRSYLASQTKESRKKSNQAISKVPTLKTLWLKTVGLRSDSSEEDRAQVYGEFHREILRHPEAFLVYAQANALYVLDKAIWEEMLRRSKPKA